MEKKDILYTIFRSETGTNVFDLLYESDLQYSELKPLLDEWVSQKILQTEDGRHYEFIGDGEMFSTAVPEEKPEGTYEDGEDEYDDDEYDDDEEYEDEYDDDEDDSDDEEDAEFARRQWMWESYHIASLWMRIRTLNAKKQTMRASGVKHELDDDLSKYILDSLGGSITVNKEDDRYLIGIDGIDLCGTDAKFEIAVSGDKVYLSDQGATLCKAEETGPSDELLSQAEHAARENGVELIDGKLCVEISAAEHTLQCLFRLYAAMERVSRIKEALPGPTDQDAAVPEEYLQALEYIVRTQKVSIIDLHAEFGCSPNTIGLMLMWMEEKGFITPLTSLKEGRKVLLTLDEFKRRFGKK